MRGEEMTLWPPFHGRRHPQLFRLLGEASWGHKLPLPFSFSSGHGASWGPRTWKPFLWSCHKECRGPGPSFRSFPRKDAIESQKSLLAPPEKEDKSLQPADQGLSPSSTAPAYLNLSNSPLTCYLIHSVNNVKAHHTSHRGFLRIVGDLNNFANNKALDKY